MMMRRKEAPDQHLPPTVRTSEPIDQSRMVPFGTVLVVAGWKKGLHAAAIALVHGYSSFSLSRMVLIANDK